MSRDSDRRMSSPGASRAGSAARRDRSRSRLRRQSRRRGGHRRARRPRRRRSGCRPSSVSPRGTTSGRACKRMRRDERDGHRVEPPHEHGPAVREVVRGRTRRRRADHAVAGHDTEILAADRPRELDHPSERRARGDDVVHGDVRLAVELQPAASAARRRRTRRRRRAASRRSSVSGSIDARKPTRPKLTPITGTSLPSSSASACRIVPSPPTATTRSAARRSSTS